MAPCGRGAEPPGSLFGVLALPLTPVVGLGQPDLGVEMVLFGGGTAPPERRGLVTRHSPFAHAVQLAKPELCLGYAPPRLEEEARVRSAPGVAVCAFYEYFSPACHGIQGCIRPSGDHSY